MSLEDYIRQLLGEDFDDDVCVGPEPAFQFVLPLPEEEEHA